jgi:hypothetical protein
MRRPVPGRRVFVLVVLTMLTGCSTASRPASPDPDIAPADPTPAKDVVVRLDRGERADLSARAREDLEQAETMLERTDRSAWGTEESNRLAAVKELMDAARTSYEAQEYEAAATLARKARLLATELAGG